MLKIKDKHLNRYMKELQPQTKLGICTTKQMLKGSEKYAKRLDVDIQVGSNKYSHSYEDHYAKSIRRLANDTWTLFHV